MNFKDIGAYINFRLYKLVEFFISILPLNLTFWLGYTFGKITYYLIPKYRKLALHNLAIAFPEKIIAERSWIAKRSFALLGANILAGLKIARTDSASLSERLEIIGEENLQNVLSQKKGYIAILLHMSAWEIYPHVEAIKQGTKQATLYQALSNKYLNAYIEELRGKTNVQLFNRKMGFLSPLQFIKENGGLGILPDQHAGDGGIWLPFFNKLASTTNLPALFACKTSAPILVYNLKTTGVARWSLTFYPPLTYPKKAKNLINQITFDINQNIERAISESPADWLWGHNRWKTPRPIFLLAKYKRGVFLPKDYPREKLQTFKIAVRSPNWLGDACMATPTVKAIKRGRPDAWLAVICPDKLNQYWQSVAEVDEVIVRASGEGVGAVAKKIKRAGDFAVGIILPNSHRSALEMWLAGIPRRVGYARKWRNFLVNQLIFDKKKSKAENFAEDRNRHHALHYFDIAKKIGASGELTDYLPKENNFSSAKKVIIGICAGAEYGSAKRFPLEKFAEIAKLVAKEFDEISWHLFGTQKEVELNNKLAQKIGDNCTNLSGKTSLVQLMKELQKCCVILTNDTGTMHLSSSLGVPTVAIFGSTNPTWTGPLGDFNSVVYKKVNCSPCYLRECPIDFPCMLGISPKEVSELLVAKIKSRISTC